MSQYGIGIDTGGTCTDAVVVNMDTGEVLGAGKTATTHHDLSLGITRAVGEVLETTSVDPSGIGVIAVSTTLATNAVVEGRGGKVGLFVIGFSKPMDVPADIVCAVKGGHLFSGQEHEPLDLEAIVNTLGTFRGTVDAYAVTAAMSFVNPSHELVAAKAIQLSDPKPVFCSHEISSDAGVRERAATAALNARLMPVMQEFLGEVRQSLEGLGLKGEVMIMRGDLEPMDLRTATERAAFTVASGPAATACFGAGVLGPEQADALVVDVGGTTTDVTMVSHGKPLVSDSGMHVGDWDTHIRAVDMSTVGVGGDSHARFEYGILQLGPERVVPLALSPNIPDPADWLGEDDMAECLALNREPSSVDGALLPIVEYLRDNGPSTPHVLQEKLGMSAIGMKSRLAGLIKRQVVSSIGFTPTDALHVLGKLDLGDADLARAGALRLAEAMGTDVENACERILSMAATKIEDAILTHILRRESGEAMSGIVRGRHNYKLIGIHCTTPLPIVGIGAAAPHLLQPVADRLATSVVFPEHYQVGNAIGAIFMARAARF